MNLVKAIEVLRQDKQEVKREACRYSYWKKLRKNIKPKTPLCI